MRTAENIIDDLERLDHGDPEINRAYEKTRRLFKDKGLPYHELLRSKVFGTIKYLIVELHDEEETMLITDLDTNNTFRVSDPKQPKRTVSARDKIREWVSK